MTSARIGQITLDALDPLPLARWWADRLGGLITQENDGWFVVVATSDGPALAFQKVDDPTPGKNKLHLDMEVDDLPAAVEDFVSAGAAKVADRAVGDFGWTTLTDPDGNVFCLAAGH